MKIAVFVNTPAQVHFYKNIVAALEGDGNQVLYSLVITERP